MDYTIIFQSETKWIIWTIMISLSTYIYIINPIRFSSKKLFKIGETTFNIADLYNILRYIIISLNFIVGYLLSITSPIFISFKYWYLLIVLINIVLIYEYKSEEVIDDGTFNLPPKYITLNTIYHYIVIILLVYHLITEKNVLKTLNINLTII